MYPLQEEPAQMRQRHEKPQQEGEEHGACEFGQQHLYGEAAAGGIAETGRLCTVLSSVKVLLSALLQGGGRGCSTVHGSKNSHSEAS